MDSPNSLQIRLRICEKAGAAPRSVRHTLLTTGQVISKSLDLDGRDADDMRVLARSNDF